MLGSDLDDVAAVIPVDDDLFAVPGFRPQGDICCFQQKPGIDRIGAVLEQDGGPGRGVADDPGKIARVTRLGPRRRGPRLGRINGVALSTLLALHP